MSNQPIMHARIPLAIAAVVSFAVCADGLAVVYPHTDPANTGRWVLNADMSDEFEGVSLDQDKWLIQGTDGVYQSNFIGRAPSQFSTDNARVESGKLKIQTRWEPDFDFSDQTGQGGLAYENITTAAVISKQQFQYGYMEIKAKAADAPISSSFWMTGNTSELDVFEHFGRAAYPQQSHLETEIWSSIHDWNLPQGNNSIWTDRMQLPFRVADDFHVYGVDWNEDGLKFYVDGIQIREVLADDVAGWNLDEPLWVWVDSETFPWHGLPDAQDLPVDYEVEYIRVWQEALAGDANADGFVGIDDLNLVLSIWNTNGSLDPRADVNGDGFIGIDDLNTVLGAWNSGTPPTIGENIPEPTTLALLGFSGMAWLKRSARCDTRHSK